MDFRKELEKISQEIFEKSGAKMDIDRSIANLSMSFACERQRQNSKYPEIPVIFSEEISDKQTFNMKMDNFHSDLFFFVKEQEKEFDSHPYPSSFYADDLKLIDDMVKKGLVDAMKQNMELFLKVLNNCETGDKIRIRRYITEGVTAKVAVNEFGNCVIKDTDEYVIVMELHPENEEELMTLFDAYPI